MEQEQQIPSEDFNLAERYLLGEMNADETVAFALRLEQDAALKTMVDELAITIAGIQQAAMKSRLDEYHTAFNQHTNRITNKPKTNSINRWLSAAAVLLLAVGLSWWAFIREDKNEALYSKYYSKEPGLVSAMSSTDNYKFDRAMVDYKTGNYDAAIKAWETLLKNNPASDTLNYFIGSAWLAKNDESRAQPYLQKTSDNNSSYFREDANWYLGLILAKEGKVDEAINLIGKSSHPDKEKLLEQLRTK